MSDPEYDFATAETEINAKLTDHDACQLNTTYLIMDAMLKTDMVDALDHLMAEHNVMEAAELTLSFMRFVVHAGHLEARLFKEADIQVPARFDVAGNDEELKVIEEFINDMRVTAAVVEGEGCVRH